MSGATASAGTSSVCPQWNPPVMTAAWPGPLRTAADGSCKCSGASMYTQSQSCAPALLPLPSLLRLLPPSAFKSVQYFTLGLLVKLCGKTSVYCKGNRMLSLTNICYQLSFVKNEWYCICCNRKDYLPSINGTVCSGTLFYLPVSLFSCYFFSEVIF